MTSILITKRVAKSANNQAARRGRTSSLQKAGLATNQQSNKRIYEHQINGPLPVLFLGFLSLHLTNHRYSIFCRLDLSLFHN